MGDTSMTIDRKVSSIESSFRMENVEFDRKCYERVKGILSDKILVADAIAELNKKYDVATLNEIEQE